MSQYDNETTYNRIRFTSEQTSIRCTNLINTVFSIVQCLISFASVVCVLVSFNGIIVIASVVASIPLFFVNKYVSSFWYKISVGRVEKQRYSDVLRDLMLRNDNIKELKLFGSLSYLKSRILNQQIDFFRKKRLQIQKKVLLLHTTISKSPGGGIGRRARFRCVCRKACRFDSCPAHSKPR